MTFRRATAANRLRLGIALLLSASVGSAIAAQPSLRPPGQLVDLGGYRLHLWCTGPARPGRPTVVLSIGGGGFAVDWSLVQRPLSDSIRVCSYDRPGYGWSDPGPYARTFRQEASELRRALQRGGERPPFVLVGQSIGGFIARQFAADFRSEVAGIVLVEAANENGKLGHRGQFVIPRTLASDRALPPVHSFAQDPPAQIPGAECDSARARAVRNARIVRPFDQLDAQAQRYRIAAISHPSCVAGRDDYFAEQMAGFFKSWTATANPLGDLPLIVVDGRAPRTRPPGLSEADWKSDTMRVDLSKLSTRGRFVADSLSGHHVQLDNPRLVVRLVRDMLAGIP